jgi:small subunit ribosomal protein S20
MALLYGKARPCAIPEITLLYSGSNNPMPITTSAKKALRQSVRRGAQNTLRKNAYKSAVKDLRKSILAKDLAKAQEQLSAAMKALDKAAKTNAIKKNKASRLKSRLVKAMNKTGK